LASDGSDAGLDGQRRGRYIYVVRLLLVEDTQRLSESLAKGFREEGVAVDVAATGAEALQELGRRPPELLILDLGLPDVDGLVVLSEARARGFRAPVLVLTARDAVASRVEALDRGADDYVIKPFAFEELYARVRALARRAAPSPPCPTLTCGDLRLQEGETGVTVAGKRVRLSPTERSLLECLMRRTATDVTRREILLVVFGYDFDPGTNVIDVHVAHLRRKLAGSTARITTVRSVGYRLDEGGAE
jgi:DNA-binding response OmpR family regulator